MIRTLIVDDEPLARSRMRRLLGPHPDIEVVGEAAAGDEAVARCLELRPQLVFLDVDMPGGTGTEALDRIRRSLPEGLRPLAVFTTAHPEHAVQAFALEGLDYLLKPIEPADLERALQRARQLQWARVPTGIPTPPTAPPVSTAPAPSAPPPVSGRLAAHRGGRVLNLDVDDVALIELEDTIAFAWTAQGRHRLAGTLAEVEARLPQPPFVRVSRSAIVQLKWVKHLEPLGAGVWLAKLDAPLEREVRVARRRVKQLRDLLGW